MVFDLGFGDAGKGLLTDFLVRRTGASLVVRFNGGAQAGHNVVTPEGLHHCFAQLGAGSFVPGTRTFLSREVVVHPTALRIEAAVFEAAGGASVWPRLRISDQAPLITPYHQATNRLRELARGEHRHGSCGVGVGETVRDRLLHPGEAVVAGDLRDPPALRRKLAAIRERKWLEVRTECDLTDAGASAERAIFQRSGVVDAWMEQAAALAPCVAEDSVLHRWMAEGAPVVFEGAQGVLLDERFGFHPYTTWSTCTPANVLTLLAEQGSDLEPIRIGVLRAHQVRHGPGPLPTEAPLTGISDHNRANLWQGAVRYGWFDAVLARYALETSSGVEALALTHLDWARKAPHWQAATSYEVPPDTRGAVGGRLARLPVLEKPSHEDPSLTQLLARAQPVYTRTRPEAAAELCGVTPALFATGPRASDVDASGAAEVLGLRSR